VETKNIKFPAFKPWLKKDSEHRPSPIKTTIPEWYKDMDRFLKNEQTDEYYENPEFPYGKWITWKGCPALFDVMTTGYVFKTPCDIEFFLDDNGKIRCVVLDEKYKDFCTEREPLLGFYQPDGYYIEHFAWFFDWGFEAPEGYSALFIPPINRFDLPFTSTGGIIDIDKTTQPGSFPFFIKDGWTGRLEAGTPIMQMIPFKRENWEAEYVEQNESTITKIMQTVSKKYRIANGGYYKNNVWQRRHYK
jgi:hypothetical protein